jgi:hypothetical protein
MRVAAFLPYYVKEIDAGAVTGGRGAYVDSDPVAIYDYKISMTSIDALEAGSI